MVGDGLKFVRTFRKIIPEHKQQRRRFSVCFIHSRVNVAIDVVFLAKFVKSHRPFVVDEIDFWRQMVATFPQDQNSCDGCEASVVR